MTPTSTDGNERRRDDINGAEGRRNDRRAESPSGRRPDQSSRRARDWRRDRPSGSSQHEGDRHRARGNRDERPTGKRDPVDHKQNNGNADKPRKAYESNRASLQARRGDAGWGNKGKERARDAAGASTTASLASRLDIRESEVQRRERRDERVGDENGIEEEDEEARQRRIRRLKRRRRSAGLDSDVDEEELFAFEKAQLERAGGGRGRGGANSDGGDERRNRKRHGSPTGSSKETKRQRETSADRVDQRPSDSQNWYRRDGERTHKAERDRSVWTSTRDLEGPDRHGRTDRSSDDRKRRNSRGGTTAWQRNGRRASPTPTAGSQSDGGSSRVGANGGKVRQEYSPDARILRRRRSKTPESRDPERRTAESSLHPGSGREDLDDQAMSEAAADQQVASQGPILTRARPDEIYERIAQVGEGTYGQVFKARASRTGVIVALKRIRMESERDGFPITAMREVKLLQGLRHENVVRLHEMMLSKNSIYMVFEYLQHDLNGVLAQTSIEFTAAHLKSLAAQLLAGLAYLHAHSILHRDLKCSNLLLNNDGTLKLADFGLARSYTKQERAPRKRMLDYTNRVVTLWYRAPELLFGETSYGDAIDVWGAGCIFLELFARKAVFQGNDEIHQVSLLFSLLGHVQPGEWPEVDNLPWYNLVRPASSASDGLSKKDRLRSLLRSNAVPGDALDVAAALLAYNPRARLSAQDALRLPYFATNEPHPQKPAALLQAVEGEWHEFESRRARRDAAAQALHAHVHREREQAAAAAAAAAAVSIAPTSADALQEGTEPVAGSPSRAESVHLTPPTARQADVSMDDSEASA